MIQKSSQNVWRSVLRYGALVLATLSTLLIPFEVIPPLLGRTYMMAPWVAVVLIGAGFLVAYLMLAYSRAKVPAGGRSESSGRASVAPRQPKLELQVREARDVNLVPDWLEAFSRDVGEVRRYIDYELKLKDKATLVFHLHLGVTYHLERMTHVTFEAEPDTDWELLQPPYQPQPLVELSYRDDDGQHVNAQDELLLLGEGHRDIVATVTFRPSLGLRNEGCRPLSGLSRLAIRLRVTAPTEAYDLQADFDPKQVHEQMEDLLEQVMNTVLKRRAGRDSLIQRGEMRRFFDIARELGPGRGTYREDE